jgi:hypothetical protein
MPPRSAVLFVLFLAAGCSGAANEWVKRGATPDVVAADLDDCTDEAHEATRRDEAIDQDIAATRGNDWEKNGTLTLKENGMAMSNEATAGDVIAGCMAGRGYRPAR